MVTPEVKADTLVTMVLEMPSILPTTVLAS